MNKRQFLASSLSAAVAAAGGPTSASAQTGPSRRVKLVFVLYRRPGMDIDDFNRYWRDKHAAIGAALPGVRKYVQNHAGSALDGSPVPCDGFAELWFDDMESLERALASPAGQAAIADSKNFLDVARIRTFTVEEVTVV